MTYREQLSSPLSKHYIDQLVQEVFFNPTVFNQIYTLIFDEEMTVAWRAAWACQKISETHPEWFTEEQFAALANLTLSTPHSGLQRGCLCILTRIALPNLIPVALVNACFEWMISPRSAIAVQALSMKMALRFCKQEPDLGLELQAILQHVNAHDYTAGFNSTRKKILKALDNC